MKKPAPAICILISPTGEEFYDAYGPMTKDKAKASRFVSAAIANKVTRFGRSAQGFWESERRAELAAKKQYEGWTHRVVVGKKAIARATLRNLPRNPDTGKVITDAQFREVAKECHEDEGTLEFDDTPLISRGSDPGAYVQAWVWVSVEDVQRLERDQRTIRKAESGNWYEKPLDTQVPIA